MAMTRKHGEPVQTETPGIAEEQRGQLKGLFPEVFSEGRVDLEKLRATLGDLLVRETKGSHERDEWLPDERRKVVCGERHFRDALGVDYRVVVAAGELP